MVSPIDKCITPPPEPLTPEDVSTLDTGSILERQPSSQNFKSEKATLPKTTSSTNKRNSSVRRNAESAGPRLSIPHGRWPSASLDLIFTPRPLEVILAERAYLISSLHRQTLQSRQLIGEYSAFEAQFASPVTTGRARRRLRKKLSHLRAQLDHAAGQEKSIFVRLGEVYTELQSHAAWSEAALWRIPLQQQHQQPAFMINEEQGYFQGYGPVSFPDTPLHGAQYTSLDPSSPVFVPGQPIYASSEMSSAVHFTSEWSSSSNLETVDETSEDERTEGVLHGGLKDAYGYKCEDERVFGDDELLSPREKRLSLPSLHSIWPEV